MESTTSPPISINIVGLQPGVTIQITETVDSDGIVSITITLPPPAALSEQNATGTITERDSDAFTLHTRGGSELRLNMAPDALSALGLQVCDTAAVTYHQDADLLIADTVNVTGTSTSGDCHSGLPSAGDVTGTITSVSPSALTVATGDGSLSFVVPDTSTTDGFLVGDVVDVSYSTSQGTLEADDVEYVEQEATGVVTAVSSSAMTITDDTTHQPDTFLSSGGAADTLGFGTFDGVAVGDQVEVIYHVSSGHRVADLAVDNSWLDLGGLGGGY
jgi:hypothetical protein